jgi:Tfp pilus assembly protein PilF
MTHSFTDKLADLLADGDIIDFGDIPPQVNAHLQQGVAAYYDDRPAAEGHFRAALVEDPTALAPWFCLTKINTYQGFLPQAAEAAKRALAAAARQGNFAADWRLLSENPPPPWEEQIRQPGSPQRFYAYMLKAWAFVSLKANQLENAETMLAAVRRLDPNDYVGHSVIAALAQRLRSSED